MTFLTDHHQVIAVGSAMLKGTILVAVVLTACCRTRLLSAAWRHALLVAALGTYAAIVLHAVVAPNLVWRVLPVERETTIAAVQPATGDVTPADAPDSRERAITSPPVPVSSTSIPLMLAIVWTLGAMALLLRLGVVHARARRMLRYAVRLEAADWLMDLEACARNVGVSRPVSLSVGAVRGPCVLGIRQPAIMLPVEASTWSAERRRMVLLHELAHVKRLDVLTTLGVAIVRALSWPNPIILVVARRVAEDREVAADDVVLGAGVTPWLYVEEVVHLAVRGWSDALQPALAEGRTTAFERRMRLALTNVPSRHALRPGGAALVMLVAVVAAGSLAGLAPRREEARVGALMTGCRYEGGAHLDVRRRLPDGRSVWIIGWTGTDCRVDAHLLTGASLDVPVGAFALPTASDTVTLQVTREVGTDSLIVSRGPRGLAFDWRPAGAAPQRLQAPPDWVPLLVDELEQHTGFGAAARLPQLMTEGGLERVVSEAERMQVDHAVGRYLEEGLRAVPDAGPILGRIIDVAGVRVTNDAQLTRVLVAAAGQPGLSDDAMQVAYLHAAATVLATSARGEIVTALARHHTLADSAARLAARLRG